MSDGLSEIVFRLWLGNLNRIDALQRENQVPYKREFPPLYRKLWVRVRRIGFSIHVGLFGLRDTWLVSRDNLQHLGARRPAKDFEHTPRRFKIGGSKGDSEGEIPSNLPTFNPISYLLNHSRHLRMRNQSRGFLFGSAGFSISNSTKYYRILSIITTSFRSALFHCKERDAILNFVWEPSAG
jgi:hypothetical protein